MRISIDYPEKITWLIDLQKISDPYEAFSKKTRKKLRSAIRKQESTEYRFTLENVDINYINKFVPLYEENIKNKKQGKVFDIRDRVLDNPDHDFPYEALSLYDQNDTYLGGIIYSDRGDLIVTGYRVFPKNPYFTSKVGWGLIADYYLYSFLMEKNKKFIRRGKDRNLYGLNSSIGLAIYKFQIGTAPYMLPEFADIIIKKDFEWDGEHSVLVFEPEKTGEKIISGKIYRGRNETEEEIREKYNILFLQDYLQIEIIHL